MLAGVAAGVELALPARSRHGATSAVEPSDLSEPSGLAPSVSIKQTTVPLPLHHPLPL
jgi:hypothetical protein